MKFLKGEVLLGFFFNTKRNKSSKVHALLLHGKSLPHQGKSVYTWFLGKIDCKSTFLVGTWSLEGNEHHIPGINIADVYVKIFTEYPYLQWTFCSHNLISSLHHLLIWVPVAAVLNRRDSIERPVMKILRKTYDVPEEVQ